MSDSSSAERREWESLPQRKRLHAPLQPEDTAEQTWGCRYSNPVACGRNKMAKVCAFVREDGICMEPPRGWPNQYAKLLADAVGRTHTSGPSGLAEELAGRREDPGAAKDAMPR